MEKIYYSIAEVSELLKLTPSTLRYWEQEFTQLSPRRNSKGTRFYTQDDIALIKQIQFLRNDQKLSIDAAKQRLLNKKDDIEKKMQVIDKLQYLRNELDAIRKQIK